jgi:hypothetical protein
MNKNILGRIGRRLPRLAAVKITAAALLLLVMGSLAAPAIGRASAAGEAVEAVFGTAVEVAPPDTISVATDAGVETLVIGAETVLKIGNREVGLDDVAEGDRLVATAVRQEDGTLLGQRVLVQPQNAQPLYKHFVGVITEVTENTVTITTREDQTITIELPEGLVPPEAGAGVTLIALLDRVTGVLTARSFERMEQIVERIEKFADEVQDEERKQALKEQAEEARTKHLSALEDARRALERARAALAAADEARQKAEEQLRELQDKFADLRARYEA